VEVTARGGPPHLELALVHAPVLNRRGEEIAATCDEFDFFDLSRLCLTYPIERFYVVQPVAAQQAMVQRLIAHARDEARDVAARGAFTNARLVDRLEEAVSASRERHAAAGRQLKVVASSARRFDDAIEFSTMRAQLGHPDQAALLLIGKGWGLAKSVIESADQRLAPIEGGTKFNHLSVRTAAAVLVDRLLGDSPAISE
jgi:hypothetical protein